MPLCEAGPSLVQVPQVPLNQSIFEKGTIEPVDFSNADFWNLSIQSHCDGPVKIIVYSRLPTTTGKNPYKTTGKILATIIKKHDEMNESVT